MAYKDRMLSGDIRCHLQEDIQVARIEELKNTYTCNLFVYGKKGELEAKHKV
jgi:hypothetical protein